MKPVYAMLVIVIALVAGFAGAKLALNSTKLDATETAYQRVIKTGVLRCGYIPYFTDFRIDPNTGEKSGIFYDLMNEVGKLANIKVEWTQELTWATISTEIQSGRVDAMCSGMWMDTQNGKFIAYSQPIFFNTVSAYGRADEKRFTLPDQLNDASVRIVSRDGGTSGIIADKNFPKATIVSLPSGVSDAEQLETMLDNKADVVFYGDDFMADFMKANPDKVKPLFPGLKLRAYGTAIGTPINDFALANFLNSAIFELKGMGVIDHIVGNYIPPSGWQPAPLR